MPRSLINNVGLNVFRAVKLARVGLNRRAIAGRPLQGRMELYAYVFRADESFRTLSVNGRGAKLDRLQIS